MIWPWLLYQRSPELFHEWFWTNNFGRFLGRNHARARSRCPAITLAFCPGSRSRPGRSRHGRCGPAARDPRQRRPASAAHRVPGDSSGAVGIARCARAVCHADARPLALLAVPGLLTAAARRLQRIAVVLAWCSSLLRCWSAGSTGSRWTSSFPARLHAHLLRMQPGYTSAFSWLEFALGLLYTAGWVWILARTRRSPERPMVVLGGRSHDGVGAAAVLFVDYADGGKSYRWMMLFACTRRCRSTTDCISSYNLGEPQRALLEYFAGIVTYRETEPSASAIATCCWCRASGTTSSCPARTGARSGRAHARATTRSCSSSTSAAVSHVRPERRALICDGTAPSALLSHSRGRKLPATLDLK